MREMAKTVVVTGFGPFGQHTVNASWQAVMSLEQRYAKELEHTCNVRLVTHELLVGYDEVDNDVPDLWQKHKPILVVHAGVHGSTTRIHLESTAYNDGHVRPDVREKLPTNGCCLTNGDKCLTTGFNLEKVAKVLNANVETAETVDSSTNQCVVAVLSNDPGRYLCNYCYYRSLTISKDGRVVFVHVPPLEKPFSSDQLADHLKTIIIELLKQCNNQNCDKVESS